MGKWRAGTDNARILRLDRGNRSKVPRSTLLIASGATPDQNSDEVLVKLIEASGDELGVQFIKAVYSGLTPVKRTNFLDPYLEVFTRLYDDRSPLILPKSRDRLIALFKLFLLDIPVDHSFKGVSFFNLALIADSVDFAKACLDKGANTTQLRDA